MGLLGIGEEQEQPIMQYVRTLENKVRMLRAIQTRFKLKSFLLGLGTGAIGGWIIFAIVYYVGMAPSKQGLLDVFRIMAL